MSMREVITDPDLRTVYIRYCKLLTNEKSANTQITAIKCEKEELEKIFADLNIAKKRLT